MNYGKAINKWREVYGNDFGGRVLMTRNGSIVCVLSAQLEHYHNQGYLKYQEPVMPFESKKVIVVDVTDKEQEKEVIVLTETKSVEVETVELDTEETIKKPVEVVRLKKRGRKAKK